MSALDAEHYLLGITLLRDKVSSFEQYPFCLSAVRTLESLQLHPSVTFFIGENGTGKSTLLEAIAVAWGFNPEGGSKNFRFGTRSSHSPLHEYLRLSRSFRRPKDGFFLRAESFFNVATEIEKLDEGPGGPPISNSYGRRPLHEQSHGESFIALLMNRFKGHGLYILDEPEAALSPKRQMAMLTRMHELVRNHAQFIIATHSPILTAYPNAKIYSLDEKGAAEVTYEQSELYATAKAFLSNPARYVELLLKD